MILYHIITNYHLLNAVVHASQQEGEKVLLYPEWLQDKIAGNNYLQFFFDKIIAIDANFRFRYSKEYTAEYFFNILGDFDKFTDIYVWGAQFSFGISLSEQNKRFSFCEEGCGILSRSYILKDIDKKDPLKCNFVDLADDLGLYSGENSNIKQVLCNQKAQIDKFEFQGNVIDWDIVDEITKMDAIDRIRLMEFFGVNMTISIPDNSVIVLTQHFSNLFMLSFEEHILIYQLLVDYFFYNKELVIKVHPNDLMYYDVLFPKSVVVREKFPAEFLPFIFEGQPLKVATIGSTATFSLKGHYENIFELDSRYERDFHFTNKYYASVCIAKALNKNISYLSANEILLKKLADSVGFTNAVAESLMETSYNENVLVVDDVVAKGEVGRQEIINLLENGNHYRCVILINSKKDYCWYDYYHRELWNDIIPVVLKKEVHQPQSEDFYADIEDEVIYVYSKNKELLNMVREMEMEKDLPHTGITVRKEILTAEQERIKMLEGILEATEKRLLYYINKEKEQ